MGSRLTWPQIRGSEEFQGRWVALDDCQYDGRTAQPLEGTVVDSDEDLVALCNRMQESDNKHCAVLFCDESEIDPPSSRRPSASHRLASVGGVPPRPFTH